MSSSTIPAAPEGNEYYEIREVPGKGCGCFALKPIPQGTRILADEPLLIMPKAKYLKSDIEKAAARMTAEQRKTYFSLHSGHGQDPKQWPSEIYDSMPPTERQRIQEQREARISKEPTLVSIFQINCMQMGGGGAAVFPHASRFNHSCNPNALFAWNAAIHKETIHTMKDVAAGEEITLSYCDQTQDKAYRRYELKYYNFVCDCPACAGDENDESSFAYQSTMRRFRLHELEIETRFLRNSSLLEGARDPGFVNRLVEIAALHRLEGEYSYRLAKVYLDIALICEYKDYLKMAVNTAAMAVDVKRGCQGEDYPDYGRYVEALDRMKARLAEQEGQGPGGM